VRRAWIGVGAESVPLPRRIGFSLGLNQVSGAAITSVEPDGPAAQGGLADGNIIVAIDGATVSGVDDLVRLLGAERIGAAVAFAVVADGRLHTTVVTPGERNGA